MNKPGKILGKQWEWSEEDDLFRATIGGLKFLLMTPYDGSPWCAEEFLTQEVQWGTLAECNAWVTSRIIANRDELNRLTAHASAGPMGVQPLPYPPIVLRDEDWQGPSPCDS